MPKFNFGDVRWASEIVMDQNSEQKVARIRSDFQAKGYELIKENNGQLVFRGPDNSVVLVDADKGEISVDLTGEVLK